MKGTLSELLKECLKDSKSHRSGGLDPNKYPSQVAHNIVFIFNHMLIGTLSLIDTWSLMLMVTHSFVMRDT